MSPGGDRAAPAMSGARGDQRPRPLAPGPDSALDARAVGRGANQRLLPTSTVPAGRPHLCHQGLINHFFRIDTAVNHLLERLFSVS